MCRAKKRCDRGARHERGSSARVLAARLAGRCRSSGPRAAMHATGMMRACFTRSMTGGA